MGIGGMILMWELMKVLNGPLGQLVDKAAGLLNKLLGSAVAWVIGGILFLLWLIPELRQGIWRLIKGGFEKTFRGTSWLASYTKEYAAIPLKDKIRLAWADRTVRRASERGEKNLKGLEGEDAEALQDFYEGYKAMGSMPKETVLGEQTEGFANAGALLGASEYEISGEYDFEEGFRNTSFHRYYNLGKVMELRANSNEALSSDEKRERLTRAAEIKNKATNAAKALVAMAGGQTQFNTLLDTDAEGKKFLDLNKRGGLDGDVQTKLKVWQAQMGDGKRCGALDSRMAFDFHVTTGVICRNLTSWSKDNEDRLTGKSGDEVLAMWLDESLGNKFNAVQLRGVLASSRAGEMLKSAIGESADTLPFAQKSGGLFTSGPRTGVLTIKIGGESVDVLESLRPNTKKGAQPISDLPPLTNSAKSLPEAVAGIPSLESAVEGLQTKVTATVAAEQAAAAEQVKALTTATTEPVDTEANFELSNDNIVVEK